MHPLTLAIVAPCALGYAVRSPIRGTASVPVDLQRRVLRRASAVLLQEGAGDDVIGDGGVGKVRWVSIDVTAGEQEPSGDDRSSVMPLFPLGAAYLPHTSPVINIFEPRYRAMYNDILFNGARRFMVTNVDSETGDLAEVGVVLYLDTLKEVSEQTQDRVKYIGQHRVIDRVRLKKVLNPSVVATRKTYLKAEVEVLQDTDLPAKAPGTKDSEGSEDSAADAAPESAELIQEQEAANALFVSLVDMQKQLNEEPRFTDAVKGSLSFSRGTGPDDQGLWGVIGLWQQFLEQRAAVLGNKMQREVQSGLAAFLKANPKRNELVNARGEIRLEDLPPELIAEIQGIQGRYREQLEDLDGEPGSLRFQALLQSESHRERLRLFTGWLKREQARLTARATLQKMFSKDEPGM